MATNLTPEEFKRLQGREFKNDAELQKALDGDDVQIAEESTMALGAGYSIGDYEMPPVHMGVLSHLEVIESTLLDPATDEHSLRDIMNAAYIMARGREAIREVSMLARRRAALDRAKPSQDQAPEHYRVYLDKIDELETTFVNFEDQAAEFWDQVGAVDVQGVAEVIVAALNHACAGFGAVPGGDSKKKHGSTLNGSA